MQNAGVMLGFGRVRFRCQRKKDAPDFARGIFIGLIWIYAFLFVADLGQ
jgi:hypothetical protein